MSGDHEPLRLSHKIVVHGFQISDNTITVPTVFSYQHTDNYTKCNLADILHRTYLITRCNVQLVLIRLLSICGRFTSVIPVLLSIFTLFLSLQRLLTSFEY